MNTPAPDPPSTSKGRVTNAEILAKIDAVGERLNTVAVQGVEQGKRLDQHIEEDAHRHADERVYVETLASRIEGNIGIAVATHLAAFNDLVPGMKKMLEDQPTIELMVKNQHEMAALRNQVERLREWMMKLIGVITGLGALIKLVGAVTHKW